MTITGHTYHLDLVLLSYAVASMASYTALELAGRVFRCDTPAGKRRWLAAGAFGMGTGIWSMHFIGMLAYHVELPMGYDFFLTLLSYTLAVIASAFALHIGSRHRPTVPRLLTSGTVMGAGISAMHYTGMAAMQVPAEVHYEPRLFLLSIAIAMSASSVALWLFFYFGTRRSTRISWKAVAAMVMGLAIAGMHYTGMEAVNYVVEPGVSPLPSAHGAHQPAVHGVHLGSSHEIFASVLSVATFAILCVALIVVFFEDKLTLLAAAGRKLERLVEERTAELNLEKQRAEVTLDCIAEAVVTTDAEGRLMHLNPVAERLTGWRLGAARGRAFADIVRLVNEETGESLGNLATEVLRGGSSLSATPGKSVLVGRDGDRHAIDESAAPIRDHEGRVIGAVLVFRDVSEKRALTHRLSYEATHDALTGLVNRRELERCSREAFASAREGDRHVLVYLDLDRFKRVNDSAGHAAGDELLRQLSHAMRAAVRKGDLVARLGGDEFAVLLHDCTLARGRATAEKLRSAVEGFRLLWNGKVLTVGVSIGVTAVDGRAEFPEALNVADRACLEAKERGRRAEHHRSSNDGIAPSDQALA